LPRPVARGRLVGPDLPNPDRRLLPGMYAFGELVLERKDVHTLPMAAIIEYGNQNCCFVYENSKSRSDASPSGH
jgi:hypothetical protein